MATKDEQDRKRLKELLATSAITIRVRFERFVERATSNEVMAEVTAALEAGEQSTALSIVQNQIAAIAPSVSEVFIDVGTATAEDLAQAGIPGLSLFPTIAPEPPPLSLPGGGGGLGGGGVPPAPTGPDMGARVGIGFDPTNPRAAEIMRAETQLFIKEITDAQMDAAREAIAVSFDNGYGTAQTARAIRESIGLTQAQMRYVESYRKLLENGSRQALNRELRDRRFDRSTEAAAQGKKQLTPDQINRMVDRYRKRAIDSRAETIARTESTRVTAQAQEESFRQLAIKLGIGNNRIIRIWHATDDDRTREWHADMQDQEAAVGSPFIDGLGNSLMHPGDRNAPLETTINCRCALTMRIAGD